MVVPESRSVSNHFQAQGDSLALLFERFLADLPSDVGVITAGQAARLIERGLFCPALVRDGDLANRAKYGCGDTARIVNVQRVREAVRLVLPADAVVLVVSKGDDNLLHLDGRRGSHFPQTADGAFAGYYPGDDTEAIGHLEALKAKGAQFLLIPATSVWWLEYYRGFRQHLERNYQQLMHEEETCAIYNLRPHDDRQPR